MTSATATVGSGILYRSRRRIAAWAFAVALGGAAIGTATTLAVTHDDSSTSKPAVTQQQRPPAGQDSADSFHYKVGPGPH